MRRQEFEITAGDTYLNGAYCSPLPRVCRAAVADGYALKTSPERIGDGLFFEWPDAIRARLAALLGLPADEIGVTTSTGFGALQIAQGLPWEHGDRMLIGPDEFPSNVYPWLALEARGVQVEPIGTRGYPLSPADLELALARPGRVRALTVAAVHYVSGDLQSLDVFAGALHARDAWLVVDGAQAAGAIALDWRALGVDALMVSGYKWTLGPYGVGALWVRPALRDVLLDVNGNWQASPRAHDFARIMDDYPRGVVPHGRRFDVGETASFLNLAAWRASLDWLLSIGVAATEAHHRRLQDRLVAGLAGLPLEPVTALDRPHRSPVLMLAPRAGLDAAALAAALAARHVHVSARGGRLRLSPGLWNDLDDVDAGLAALHDAVAAARA